jgi:hypothetical protein
MMMLIQLRRLLIHNRLRIQHRVGMLQPRRPPQLIILLLLCGILLLLIRMFIDEQILNCPFARRALVHGEGVGELPVRSDLNRVEQVEREVLAIVADQVVGGAFGAHLVDCHFA